MTISDNIQKNGLPPTKPKVLPYDPKELRQFIYECLKWRIVRNLGLYIGLFNIGIPIFFHWLDGESTEYNNVQVAQIAFGCAFVVGGLYGFYKFCRVKKPRRLGW